MIDNVPWYFAVPAGLILTAIYLLMLRHERRLKQEAQKKVVK